MTNLKQVKGSGFCLHWPDSIGGQDRARGECGYVVDLDAPFEGEWCAGQEHKLEDALSGAEASAITNQHARSLITKLRADEEHQAKVASGEIKEPERDVIAEVAAAGKRKAGAR